MNERDEQLLTDYLFGELDEAARSAVEARLKTDRAFARALSALEETFALAVLAETPAAEPSADLRARILADVDPAEGVEIEPGAAPKLAEVVVFPAWAQWGWGVAAGLALVAGLLGVRLNERSATVAVLEARLGEAERSIADVEGDLRLALATRSTLEARIAELDSKRSIDALRIASLSSDLEKASFGFAVFDPASDEGVIEVVNLPELDGARQDYQLWVVDPQYPHPVDGGVFQVGADGRGRLRFQAKQPVSTVAAFAVSLEKKGGVPVAEGPMVLVGALPARD